MKWSNKGHEYDYMANLLAGKTQCYIYGIGQRGQELYDHLDRMKKWINWDVTVIDGNVDLQNSGFCGIPVLSPSELNSSDMADSFVVVCATDQHTAEMIKNAEERGYVYMKNLFDHHFFLCTYLAVHFMYQQNICYISSLNLLPSTVCNLNCNGCLNFNAYIKKHITYGLDELKASVDLLFSKADLLGRFHICGGEPLLYPGLIELIEHIGENYRSKILFLEVVTNGTIIPSDELCQTLKKHDVRVFLDDYRKTVDNAKKSFPLILEKLCKNSIDVKTLYVDEWIDLVPNLNCEKQISEDQLSDFFTQCSSPYHTLNGQKISMCCYSHFACQAGINDYHEDEYLDLTTIDDKNKFELAEFKLRFNKKGYTEFCKRCGGLRNNKNFMKPSVQLPKGVKRL